ncbi:GDSL-type esterase/lipase family protein [Gorillibacterium sp. sgz5001074]|uniref:GDSL-type esterase/lipase family protein n=1 Tax=Gorillibacterium sp. sgz5001074 TaxID=3446695 RepID=UPI003F662E94
MNPTKFYFGSQAKEGYIRIPYDANDGVPFYDPEAGFGFVGETCATPPRPVHPQNVTAGANGFYVTEPEFEEETVPDHYNHYGMAFRIQAPPGAYEIQVLLAEGGEDATVSISGLQASKLSLGGYWDAAGLIPIRHTASREGRLWSYTYVNGREYLDIEIEPNRVCVPAGVEEIVLRPVPSRRRLQEDRPTVFTLGDSTVKSYTFEEAPMCGWGQVFDNLFDLDRVNVLNYSMGGRSFKNTYQEGRFNDLLLAGCEGDYVLMQFGHNEERTDEDLRFGRGATEETYDSYIRQVYVPALRARGMIPVLVTPVSRIDARAKPGHIYTNSFKIRRFPDVMKRAAADLGVTLIDLNTESVEYYNAIGVEATISVFMSIEAGESPGKTNDGSFANGHPSLKNDGTHYKEALAKQLARMAVQEFIRLGDEGDPAAAAIASALKAEVIEAAASGDWSHIFPEVAADTVSGAGAYYRNQIEKMLQLGVLHMDGEGRFHPRRTITEGEFLRALSALMGLPLSVFDEGYGAEVPLIREVMGAMLADAYRAAFQSKPPYMTDYNGTILSPGDPGYDPNLDTGGQGAYSPLLGFEELTDTARLSPHWKMKVRDAYELGLLRPEKGIARGQVAHGKELEPKLPVTRAKAAKTLYFMWVLMHPVKVENDLSRL